MLCRSDLLFCLMLAKSFTLQPPTLGWAPACISGLQGQENPRVWVSCQPSRDFCSVSLACFHGTEGGTIREQKALFLTPPPPPLPQPPLPPPTPPPTPNQSVFTGFLLFKRMQEDKLMISFKFYRPNSTAQKHLPIIPHILSPKIMPFYCRHFVLFCFHSVTWLNFIILVIVEKLYLVVKNYSFKNYILKELTRS